MRVVAFLLVALCGNAALADYLATTVAVSNVILEAKNPDRYYFRAEFPVVGPVGTSSFTSQFWTTTEVVHHLSTTSALHQFTRATWTLDSFTREPWPDITQNFATNFFNKLTLRTTWSTSARHSGDKRR
jgi:hypothetical protein